MSHQLANLLPDTVAARMLALPMEGIDLLLREGQLVAEASRAHERLVNRHAVEELAAKQNTSLHCHSVQFYESEEFLHVVVADYISDGLSVDAPVIIIARPERLKHFVGQVEKGGRSCKAAIADGRLLLLDAHQTMASFIVNGMPDADLFKAVIGPVVRKLYTTFPGSRLRAYGEMVDILWCQGNPEGAIRLEELWNQLAENEPFALLCGYGMDNFRGDEGGIQFHHVCRVHSHVLQSQVLKESREAEVPSIAKISELPTQPVVHCTPAETALPGRGHKAIEADQLFGRDMPISGGAPGMDYSGTVRGLILATAAVATVVLCGWVLQIEAMKRIAPGLTSMNPMTAICFELAAFVLWSLKDGRPEGGRAALINVLSVLMVTVGGFKILDLLTGSTLCPDALLFKAQLDYGQTFPSRMAPNVAASFVLIGISLLCLDRPWWTRFLHPQWLITPILCAALAALIGYAYDTSGFYKVKSYIPMALHSAVCLMMLSAAIILARPQQGYLKNLARGSPGARSFGRLLPACLLVPALLGGVAVYGGGVGWTPSTATSIATVMIILAMTVLAFLNSLALNSVDDVRRKAEFDLKALVSQLDRRNLQLSKEVAERRRLQEVAGYQATHDQLTELPNRVLLIDRLRIALLHSKRSQKSVGLLMLDLDHFKRINDTLGHHAGDLLLVEVAKRISSCVRGADTVARMGGDEFVLVLPEVCNEGVVERIASDILDAISKPVMLGSHELSVTPSIGISLYPRDGADANALLRNADIAMYHAKSAGRHQIRLFSADMEKATQDKLRLEDALHRALRQGEFELHYQPQVCLRSGKVVGLEALLRWPDGSGGMVPPDRFIPVAEECGLILPIGEWVLRTACREGLALQKLSNTPLQVAVNISPRQFRRPEFVAELAAILSETGLSPATLELEITESLLMEQTTDSISRLREIRALGVGVAIDDFGVGYSSLSYITRFPISTLKIDRSFVSQVPGHGSDAAVVQTIIALASSLHIRVVAEGVESATQLDFLRQCDGQDPQSRNSGSAVAARHFLAQGFYYSRAVPFEAFAEVVTKVNILNLDNPT